MFQVLGVIAAVLALTLFAWQGFHLPFGPVLTAIVEDYEKAAAIFFRLVEPSIRAELAAWGAYFGWTLELLPHWKHAFVLMWLYFGASAQDLWRAGNWGSAIGFGLWGGLIALLSGVVAGTVPLDATSSNMAMPLAVIFGVFVFELSNSLWYATFHRFGGMTWPQQFVRQSKFDFAFLAAGLVLVAAGLALSVSALLITAIYILGIAIFWLADPDSRTGQIMLVAILIATVFALAGLAGV